MLALNAPAAVKRVMERVLQLEPVAANHEIVIVVVTQVKLEPDRPVNTSAAVGNGDGAALGGSDGAGVGLGIGSCEGDGIGSCVGLGTGSCEGDGIGSCVGSGVGSCEGPEDGLGNNEHISISTSPQLSCVEVHAVAPQQENSSEVHEAHKEASLRSAGNVAVQPEQLNVPVPAEYASLPQAL